MTLTVDYEGSPSSVIAELRAIADRLRTNSSGGTVVACAFGIARRAHAWYDESNGRLFDLASLTKPLFTARAALASLAQSADLARVAAELGVWPRNRSDVVYDLLRHTAGLPADLPVDIDGDAVYEWVRPRISPSHGIHRQVIYSDVGYWILGRLIAGVTDEKLYRSFERAAEQLPGEVAFGSVPAERAVASGPLLGGHQVVHDPAARQLGDSGHAGAFATLDATVAATINWLDPAWADSPIGFESVNCGTHDVPGGHRSLAWTLAGDPFHAVAHDWPTTTLCHTGFTGTSVAWDPVSGWWAVLLSNAVPVDHDATPVLIARRLFHAVAARSLHAVAG